MNKFPIVEIMIKVRVLSVYKRIDEQNKSKKKEMIRKNLCLVKI